jgi:ferrochelatase
MHDAVLLIGFGGPTKPDEIRPFLDNVLRGRPVPPARVEEVVHHYQVIGGRSPFNELTMKQAAALRERLAVESPQIPVFVGMRNWAPYVEDTLREMAAAGITSAIGFILAPHRTEASWERYQQTVRDAQSALGPTAPNIDYVQTWHDHPLFIEAVADRVNAAMASLNDRERAEVQLIFTAHSIPVAMAANSPYVDQLTDSARLVADRIGHRSWSLAFQSRSGNPREPWLEPDINDALRKAGKRAAVVVPIGFICDHVEVLYDLDVEAAATARHAGIHMERALTVNDHPKFIQMMADVIRTHRTPST